MTHADATFTWTCPSEGCRYENTENVISLGPSITLVCDDCNQWFDRKDLRPEDAAAWDKAIREVQ